jgi:hypothetical protein
MRTEPSGSPLKLAMIIGTVLQVAMVLAGHWVLFIKAEFAAGGMAISLLAGVLYGYLARAPRARSVPRGAIVGGGSALLGIVVSWALGDVPPLILVVGTLSSAIGGAIGGAVFGERRP